MLLETPEHGLAVPQYHPWRYYLCYVHMPLLLVPSLRVSEVLAITRSTSGSGGYRSWYCLQEQENDVVKRRNLERDRRHCGHRREDEALHGGDRQKEPQQILHSKDCAPVQYQKAGLDEYVNQFHFDLLTPSLLASGGPNVDQISRFRTPSFRIITYLITSCPHLVLLDHHRNGLSALQCFSASVPRQH